MIEARGKKQEARQADRDLFALLLFGRSEGAGQAEATGLNSHTDG